MRLRLGLTIRLALALAVAAWLLTLGLGGEGETSESASASSAPAPDSIALSGAREASLAADARARPTAASPSSGPSNAPGPHPGEHGDPTASREVALVRTDDVLDPPKPLLPAALDDAPPDVIRTTLQQAIEEARVERPLAVPPAVLDQIAEAGSVRVIFETGPGEDGATLARTLDSGGRPTSVEDLRVFPLLGHGAAKLSPGALLNLIRETATEQVELDEVHRPSLLSTIPQIGADVAHANEDDGDGFAVAVIDTGVDGDHPMFGSRLIEEACFSVSGDCPNDANVMLGAGAAAPCSSAQCDHGTHVAGIAVGDNGALVGVAPHARLIAINVFSDIGGEAGAYTSDILAAMQHVLALSAFHAVASVNLSLGGDAFASESACDADSPSMRNAVQQLRNARIATVAAAGNDGFTNAISSPGCLSNVIAVGSVGDADGVSAFSNSADFLTLFAPGESVVSAAVGGGTRSAAGTSMATPHVAGAIAAIREVVPDATVTEIENALALSGEPILDARNGITKPRVQLDAAIETLVAAGAGGGSSSSTTGGSQDAAGGGGGGCGLVGIEPFLLLPLVRIGRRTKRERSRAAA